MSIELKIKSKHLAQEARIIRFEEKKLKATARWSRLRQNIEAPKATSKLASLHLHRTRNVRFENRATFLARAYIEGKPYSSIEQKRSAEKERDFIIFVLPRVLTMVQKYYNKDISKDHIAAWLNT